MKKLIIRLSSLGDVVLASAALEGTQVWDWVVLKEYSQLFEGHPKIHRLWLFKRVPGFWSNLSAWRTLCRQIWEAQYDEIVDLHRTHRTFLMKVFFAFWNLSSPHSKPKAKWRTVSKQRFRLYGYFIFKSLWPKEFRPTQWIQRYCALVGIQRGQPNLRHLLKQEIKQLSLAPNYAGYLCVMPSSKWPSKEWPVEKYVETLGKVPALFPVILGTAGDGASNRLVQELSRAGIPHESAIGRWDLKQTAQVLSGAQGFLGADTGLAHIAQAVGTRSVVIYGPSTPETGFGVWEGRSKSVGIDLWCRPCGKDGRLCYRFGQKYECLKGLDSGSVLAEISSK